MAVIKLNDCLDNFILKNSTLVESHMNNDVCNSMFEDVEEQSNTTIPEVIGQKKLPDDFIDWIKQHICWDGSEPGDGYLMLGSDTEYDGNDPDFLDSHDWGDVTDKYDWQVFGYQILIDPDSLQVQKVIPVVEDVKADTIIPVDTFLAPSGYEYDVRLTPDTAKQIEELATDYLADSIDDNDDDDDDYFDVEQKWERQHRPYDKEDYDRLDDMLQKEFRYYGD